MVKIRCENYRKIVFKFRKMGVTIANKYPKQSEDDREPAEVQRPGLQRRGVEGGPDQRRLPQQQVRHDPLPR